MRVAVLSTGPRPCRFLPVQKRIVASRSYGTAPESDSARSAPALLPSSSVSPPPPDVGESLREWLVSPFDIAAFGPRLTVGALLSAPEKIQNLQREISKAQEVINSPAPAEDKGKLLAAQLETLTTEALEKGADVEADILQQVKVYLPEDIAQRVTTPETPVSKARAAQNDAMGVVTELPDDIELN